MQEHSLFGYLYYLLSTILKQKTPTAGFFFGFSSSHIIIHACKSQLLLLTRKCSSCLLTFPLPRMQIQAIIVSILKQLPMIAVTDVVPAGLPIFILQLDTLATFCRQGPLLLHCFIILLLRTMVQALKSNVSFHYRNVVEFSQCFKQ